MSTIAVDPRISNENCLVKMMFFRAGVNLELLIRIGDIYTFMVLWLAMDI